MPAAMVGVQEQYALFSLARNVRLARAWQGCGLCLYSPRIREGAFSETGLPLNPNAGNRESEKSSSRKLSISLFAAVRVVGEGPGVGGLDMKDPDPLLCLEVQVSHL